MTQPRDLDPILLARYLSGESSPAEVALVGAWVAADALRAAELDEMRLAWNSARPLEGTIDVDVAWRKVGARIRGDARDNVEDCDHRGLRLEKTGGSPRRFRALTQLNARHNDGKAGAIVTAEWIAAASILVLAGSAAIYGHRARAMHNEAETPRTTQQFIAARGQRSLIDLADGTHIVLDPATHLTVSMPSHGPGVREIALDGAAIFTVTHDRTRPFVVHSRYGTTLDVGTSFAVQAYAGEPYRVVVRDGRVAIGRISGAARPAASTSPKAWPVLVAGDVATRASDGTMRIEHGQNVSDMLDWSNGRLTFEHRRFVDLVPELERWYSVEIKIATPELGDRTITGQFDTESRTEALKAIGRALGARYTIQGAHVTFSAP